MDLCAWSGIWQSPRGKHQCSTPTLLYTLRAAHVILSIPSAAAHCIGASMNTAHAQPILTTYKDNAEHSKHSPNEVSQAPDSCRRNDLEQLASADLQTIGKARREGPAGDGSIGTAMRNISIWCKRVEVPTSDKCFAAEHSSPTSDFKRAWENDVLMVC